MADTNPGRCAMGDMSLVRRLLDITVDCGLTPSRQASYGRCGKAVRIFHAISRSWVINSGGSDPRDLAPPSGVTMRDELIDPGVPPTPIVLESSSQNKHDEAVAIAPLLRSFGVRAAAHPRDLRRSAYAALSRYISQCGVGCGARDRARAATTGAGDGDSLHFR